MRRIATARRRCCEHAAAGSPSWSGCLPTLPMPGRGGQCHARYRRGVRLRLLRLDPRLTPCTSPAHLSPARRPDGRCRLKTAEESPGSTGIRCRPTAGGGDPRDSATENKPPAQGPHGTPRARAKRCGKSAPRPWQQGRQGKPHREQDRIGTAVPARVQRHSRLAVRVGRVRRAARRVPEEWSSRAKNGADRTRLTGRLAPFAVATAHTAMNDHPRTYRESHDFSDYCLAGLGTDRVNR
jgi:hypothetical protein